MEAFVAVTPEDIDRVVGGLAVDGRAPATRRGYVQIFKGFHRFLRARKAVEIEAAFGVRLVCPVDEFNASRHSGDDSPALLSPPTRRPRRSLERGPARRPPGRHGRGLAAPQLTRHRVPRQPRIPQQQPDQHP
ncbi:hypothetical protein ACIGZJ_17230 [Kitasatospora sp. NPDC052868]|uniref:hypothetical protein n=1 Tax=Kitasatospora sp. NPDC052868 TaxID=3364060 RepID=UPI0037CC7B68